MIIFDDDKFIDLINKEKNFTKGKIFKIYRSCICDEFEKSTNN